VFCLDDWCVKKVIKLPEYVSGVQHIEFIPQLFDAGANKVSNVKTYRILPGWKIKMIPVSRVSAFGISCSF